MPRKEAMPRFLITLSLEVPADDGGKAEEKVREFFELVRINGQRVNFFVDDIEVIQPNVPQEE